MSTSRPRRWRVQLLAGCALLAAGCGGAKARVATTTTVGWTTQPPHPTGAGAAVPTPGALLAKALANGNAKGWAHVDVMTTNGGVTTVLSTDLGPAGGHQVVTVKGAHAEALLVGGVAYARGDAATVTSYFGLPTADTTVGGQWVSLLPNDRGYSGVSIGMNLSSALTEYALTAPYRVGAPTVVGGQQVVPISGIVSQVGKGPSGLGTLYITPGAATLPVELDIAGADGSKSTITYSRWGVAVALAAPVGAVRAASLVTDD
jgi:hypothetical protein